MNVLSRTPDTLERLRSQIPESAIGALRETDRELWNWCTDQSFRDQHLRKQRDATSPKPAPAPIPQPAPRSGGISEATANVLFDHIESVSKAITAKAVSGLASASRVSEIETDLRDLVRALQERCGRDEKRIGDLEHRYSEQYRHLRNLEARIRGGVIERTPPAPAEGWPPSNVKKIEDQQ